MMDHCSVPIADGHVWKLRTPCGVQEMSLAEVSLEGLRQWNMDMDVEYQYETFNGLPVYYGGDMYDLEDAEDDPVERAHVAYVEDYNFDVPEGMELMAYNRRRPDGGEARNVDTVEMVPMCRTVAGVTHIAPDESSDMSGTDTAELIGSDIEVSGQWPDLSDEKDCFGSDVGSSVDGSLSFSDFDSVDSMWTFVLIQTRAPCVCGGL